MNYRSVTNKRRTRAHALQGTVVFLAVLVFIGFGSSMFTLFAQGIGVAHWWEESVVAAFVSRADIMEENEYLRARVREEHTTNSLAQFYHDEYQEMWQQYTGVEESAVTGAEVLLRPPYSAYDYLVLDKGSLDGVEADQFVVAQGQYVVGYIEAVTARYSRAVLFTAPRKQALVSVDGNLYPAEGQGGGVAYIRLPRSFTDSREQTVRIQGAGPYTLGVLETASFRPQDSYVKGVLTMPVNLFALERVVVVNERYTDTNALDEEFNEIELDN